MSFRREWCRYCESCNVIIFMVDASKEETLNLARRELHLLLENEPLKGIPILVLANKIDLSPHLNEN